MAGSDTIVDYSQLAGDQRGLDAPRPPMEQEIIREGPVGEIYGLEELLSSKPAGTITPPGAKEKKDNYKAYARVFIVGAEGHAEYEELLNKGANGHVILARREIHDIIGTQSYKVYLEWMERVEQPKKRR